MAEIQLKQVTKIVRGEPLFKVEHLQAHDGDRVGIIGRNGAGKSTLAHLITKQDHDYQGQISTIGRVIMVAQIADTEQQSGGQAMLSRLKQAFHARPEILILDEPSANLDDDHQAWLQQQIKHYRGLLLLISHDRALLNAVTTKIWSVTQGEFSETVGNYATYQQLTAQAYDSQMSAYQQQKREQRQLKAAVEKRKTKANQIRKGSNMSRIERTKSKSLREQTAAKMEQAARKLADRGSRNATVQKPFEQQGFKLLDTDFPTFTGKTVLSGQNLTVKQGTQVLLKQVSFQVKPGDRLALTGPNGIGKSTLLKAIQKRAAGIQISQATKLAIFQQDMAPLQTDQTVWQAVEAASRLSSTTIRQVLGALGLPASFYQSSLADLSGGELVKVQLAQVLVSYSNCLILDEPTNYLDTTALQALTDYLQNYPGTVIFVAHDAVFRKAVATRTLQFDQQKLIDPAMKVTIKPHEPDRLLLEQRYETGLLTGSLSLDELKKLKQQIDNLA